MKKYGSEAYKHVLKQMNAAPERTLMIDDSIANKAGAEAAGIHFAHVLKEDDLAEILKQQWGVLN
jgi:HAD superfamily hydrolase (TIGR01509 family)